MDYGVHIRHCYKGEYEDSCKYGERDCPAKPEETSALDKAVEKYDPKTLVHFINGWNMHPEWWTEATESWKLGWLAKALEEEK